MSDQDCLLLADGINKNTWYFAARGSIPIAKESAKLAKELIDMLYYRGNIDIYESPVYEPILWINILFELQPDKISLAVDWAEARKRYDAKSYFLFLKIILTISPEFREYIRSGKGYCKMVKLSEMQVNTLNKLISEFEDSIFRARYAEITDGTRNYSDILSSGLNCLKCWVNGDIVGANNYLDCLILHCSLLKSIRIPAFSPIFFGAFVAYQFHFYSKSKLIQCEALIVYINKIVQSCWIKLLVDFLLGNVDMPRHVHMKTGKNWNETLRLSNREEPNLMDLIRICRHEI